MPPLWEGWFVVIWYWSWPRFIYMYQQLMMDHTLWFICPSMAIELLERTMNFTRQPEIVSVTHTTPWYIALLTHNTIHITHSWTMNFTRQPEIVAVTHTTPWHIALLTHNTIHISHSWHYQSTCGEICFNQLTKYVHQACVKTIPHLICMLMHVCHPDTFLST